MSFMRPQIVKGKWIMVDGDNGITYIPAGYISEKHIAELIQLLEDNGTIDLHHTEIAQFVLDRRASAIMVVNGFGARLSAPGYMDATDWSVFRTRAEAEAFLKNTYDLDDQED